MATNASPLVTGTLLTTGTRTITLKPTTAAGASEPLATLPQYQIVSGTTPTGAILPVGGSTTGTGTAMATLTPSADGLSCTVTGATAGLLVILATAQGDPAAGVDDLYQEFDITVTAPEDTLLGGTFVAE